MDKLKHLFAPPTFSDRQLTSKARVLHYLVLPLFIASLLLGISGFLRTRSLGEGIGASFFSAFFLAYILQQIRKGRLQLISYFIPIGILITVGFAAYQDGILANRHIVSLLFIVIIVSVVLDEFAIILFGILSLIPIWVITYLNAYGYIAANIADEPLMVRLVLITTVWLIAIYLLRYAMKITNKNAHDAKLYAQELEIQYQDLQRTQQKLQAQTEELSQLNIALQNQVHERELMAQALTLNQAFSRNLLNAIPDLILRVNKKGDVLDIKLASDPASFSRLSVNQQWIGQNLMSLFPKEMEQGWLMPILDYIAKGSQFTCEYQSGFDSLDSFAIEGRVLPVDETEAILIIRDSTLIRKREIAHQHSQRLESIGVLAGGVAHDFNNLLTSILGQIVLANIKVERRLDPSKHINRAKNAAERAADLTRQLLAYSGKGQFIIESIELNDLIKESILFLETIFPKNVVLDLQLSDDPCVVEADKGQIQQVILNLLINAADAVSQNEQVGKKAEISMGIIKVKGKNIPETHLVGTVEDNQTYISLAVIDNGYGIPDDIVSHIFEPYFSTKGVGRGMGLSATLGIIKSVSGALRIETEAGAGTHFCIYIPESLALSQKDDSAKHLAINVMSGQVLVVDDDEEVRSVATSFLQELGYQTAEASNGQEAINLLKRHGSQISFVLLDVQMPILDGPATLKLLREMYPNLGVVLSSGYTNQELNPSTPEDNLTFLQKPYQLRDLRKAIHELMVAV